MSDGPHLQRLEEAVKLYEATIASFEKARDRMKSRRRSAPDSVMVLLDQSLAHNQRTLETLESVLATTRLELQRARRSARET